MDEKQVGSNPGNSTADNISPCGSFPGETVGFGNVSDYRSDLFKYINKNGGVKTLCDVRLFLPAELLLIHNHDLHTLSFTASNDRTEYHEFI